MNLNTEQQAAVRAPLGPVLVRAGAGSGKTRVLTLRIAHLIQAHQATPSSILAVTFTNKAADELRGRLRELLGKGVRGITAATFHSVGLRILRESVAGRLRHYSRDFSIYGSDEQLQLAAEAQTLYTGRPPLTLDPDQVLGRISRLKSQLLTPQLAARIAGSDPQAAYIAALYRTYQRKLESHNAIDFDDCVLLAYRLLAEYPDLHEQYTTRWRHVLVDEYQDTDRTQYALLELLTRRPDDRRSLFAVGDSQQAIYGFRNADHTIITQFERDFPQATVIDLATNYRSRQEILDAAYAVIRHATTVDALVLRAHAQRTWDFKALGIDQGQTARDEADRIGRNIAALVAEGRQPREIAVLFRTGFMSRELERGLRNAHIPYIVRGNGGFYDRSVIRDALGYLRAIANPSDGLSLTRIVNKPARGITAATLESIVAHGNQRGLAIGDALLDNRCWVDLKPKAAEAVRRFAHLLRGWRQRVDTTYPPANLLVDILRDSGYRHWIATNMTEQATPEAPAEPAWAQQGMFWDDPPPTAPGVAQARPSKPKKQERMDDLELLDELERAAGEHTSLSEFLQEVALMTALKDEQEERNAVQLLTIHAAKGLEWPIVFVAGLEEGTLPHERSLADAGGVEEERRLCYVALTRAKERLLLSWTPGRQRGGQSKRSRFLDEIEAYGKERVRGSIG